MAISTQRKLEELESECKELNITVKPTKRKKLSDGSYTLVNSKDDCVRALRDFYIAERKRLGTYPPMMDFMLSMDGPMLAQQLKVLKPEEQKIVRTDGNNWIYEEKLDGCRCVYGYSKQWGFDFYSRNISVTDYLPVSYKEKIWLPEIDYSKITDEFILDSECINTNPVVEDEIKAMGIIAETQLQLVSSLLALNAEESLKIQEKNPLMFHTFDILQYNGEDLRDKPFKERYKYLMKVLKQLTEAGFYCKTVRNNIRDKMTKDEFWHSIVDKGGEGCIAKNVNASYDYTGLRHAEWVKIKRTVSQTLADQKIGDSLDAFIIGYEKADPDKQWANLVGALKLGIYLLDDNDKLKVDEDGNPIIHWVGTVANISMELRTAITTYDEAGEPILTPEMYGVVCEIDGQDLSSKSLRLSHCILKGLRRDRSADTCKIRESVLRSMIL